MAESFPPEPLGDRPESSPPNQTESPTNSESQPWWTRMLLPAALFLVVLSLGFWGVYFAFEPAFTADAENQSYDSEADSDFAANDGSSISTSVAEDQSEQDAELERLRAIETKAIRTAELEQFTALRDQIRQKLGNLATEMRSWETLLQELLTEEKGKRIASDKAYVEQFVSIYDQEQFTQPEYEALQRQFLPLEQPIEQAEQHDTYLPSSELLAQLKQLDDKVTHELSALYKARRDILAIERFAASRTASNQTLQEAMDELQAEQQRMRIEEISATRRQERELTTAELAAAEADREQQRRELEIARIAREKASLADETTRVKLQAEADARKRELERQKAALEREFQRDLPVIRSLLRPFITPGMTQPKGRGFVSASQQGPVSLAKLRSTGALEPTVGGRQTLYWITAANKMNDRDLGSFPSYFGGAADWQRKHPTIKRAQDLLIKYGELLVEKKMMAE